MRARRRGRGDMAGVGRAEEREQHLNGELPPEPEDRDGAAGLGAEDGAKKKRKKKKKGRAGPAGRGRAAPRPCADGLSGVRGLRPAHREAGAAVGGRGSLKGPGVRVRGAAEAAIPAPGSGVG